VSEVQTEVCTTVFFYSAGLFFLPSAIDVRDEKSDCRNLKVHLVTI